MFSAEISLISDNLWKHKGMSDSLLWYTLTYVCLPIYIPWVIIITHNNMFACLFIFPGYSPQETASITDGNEQGDLFYSKGPQENLH